MAPEDLALLLSALKVCAKCGAVIPEIPQFRQAHDRFHEGLRRLWEAQGTTNGASSPPWPTRSTRRAGR